MSHAHSHLPPKKRLADMQNLCVERGLRLTAPRLTVMQILLNADKALSAYEILDLYSAVTKKKADPPTVYRALDFLEQNHFISKINSLGRFMLCEHPEANHDCLFLVCKNCGEVEEIESPAMRKNATTVAGSHKYRLEHLKVELYGLCQDCH
jgi:Fur family zinc uptake transcriptional regulator